MHSVEFLGLNRHKFDCWKREWVYWNGNSNREVIAQSGEWLFMSSTGLEVCKDCCKLGKVLCLARVLMCVD